MLLMEDPLELVAGTDELPRVCVMDEPPPIVVLVFIPVAAATFAQTSAAARNPASSASA